MDAETLRSMLIVYLVVAYSAAALYLRQRRMSLEAYLLWGLLALFIPALGPFVVIVLRPGQSAWGVGHPSRRRGR